MKSRIEKYLGKYGYPSYNIISDTKHCKYAVVVPAIAEYENIKLFLNSFSKLNDKYFHDTILLFVINNQKSSTEEIKKDNLKSLELLKNCSLNKLNIGYIDAASEGNELPEKDAGVGLARKIGMDAVLKKFTDEDNVIICTDADCTFDTNYLTRIIDDFSTTRTDAAVIKFKHTTDSDETADAVINYEIFLRYYVAGLKYAKSPYAFHTIGSSMACTAGAYIKTEGMNKRKAAEDFYFLEKLAKNYEIKKINDTVVYPSSRRSWRVPFGTGQRMNRILSNTRDEYVLYHPDCFGVLAGWHEIFFKSDILNSFEYLDFAEKVNNHLFDFLCKQGFEKDWNNILKNSKEPGILQRQKIKWFDGFRTLKLIHYLRDNAFNSIPMFDALDKLFIMLGSQNHIKRNQLIPSREIQMQYLNQLREMDDN